VLLGTLLGLGVIALGALGSWRIYAAESETSARKLVATVGLLACALYTIGVVLPLIAALVIPRCWA
jgi:VIT1/CCC1 family predicted Fe2+/Mn2+ transporter